MIKNVLRVVYGIMATHLLNKFQRFLKGIKEKKTLKNLIETKDLVIQKADKGNAIVILSKNDNISRLNRVLDDTSKFKRFHVEEGQALNHNIHMEERIIDLLTSLENQN